MRSLPPSEGASRQHNETSTEPQSGDMAVVDNASRQFTYTEHVAEKCKRLSAV